MIPGLLLWVALLGLGDPPNAAVAETLRRDDVPPFGFAGIELYKLEDDALGLTAADLNGDQRTDFAVINNQKNRIEIFLQKTPEAIEADRKKPAKYDDINQLHDDARFRKELIPLEMDARALAAADFDGDGSTDLAYLADPGRVFITKRTNARWSAVRDFRVKDAAKTSDALLAADLNRDGRTDLAVLKKGAVAVLYQKDTGGLRGPTEFPTGLDGAMGLAFVEPKNDSPHLVFFRRNNRTGIAARALLPSGLGPEQSFETGKMSRVSFPGSSSFSIISVTSNADRIEFRTVSKVDRPDMKLETPPAFYPVTADRDATGNSFGYGDVNGDGRTDILLTKPSAASILVFLQREDGVFDPPVTCGTFAGATSPCVGDFDGDGTAEVIAVSPAERTVGIAEWQDGHLSIPKPLSIFTDKPLLAVAIATPAIEKPLIVTPVSAAERTGLAVVIEKGRDRNLVIATKLDEDAKAITVKLAMRSPPTRLLTADLDNDGGTDFVVLDNRGTFNLIVDGGNGKYRLIESKDVGGAALAEDAEPASFQIGRLPNGRQALLSTKKTIGRALALDDTGHLAIQEQYNAGEEAKLSAVARLPKVVVVVDRSSGGLVVLQKGKTGWDRVQEIDLSTTILRGVHAMPLDQKGSVALVVVERNGIYVLRPGTSARVLEPMWTYQCETEGAKPWLVIEGDFNNDDEPDLAVTDYTKRGLEFVLPPKKAGEKAKRALRFEMFEEKKGHRSRNYVREMVKADVNADGKDDLLVLLHDRAVVYLQE